MRIRIVLSLLMIVLLVSSQAQAGEEGFADIKAKRSYCVGVDIGQNLKDGKFDLDIDQLVQGIRDSYQNSEKKVSEEEIVKTLTEYQQELQKQHAEQQTKLAEENTALGKAYLEQNAKKDGVTVTESGLQYTVIQSGSGATPTLTDKVKVHYRGAFIDGKEFDSSYTRGEPVVFGVNQVIPGWTEILQKMKEGDKFQVVIPSDMAYGPNGAGQAIPPNSTLVFDIELIAVNPQE